MQTFGFVLAYLVFDRKKKTRRFLSKCMSFVPAPQQANAAGANNAPSNNQITSANAAAGAADTADAEAVFKIRTFDIYWVEKSALMYRDGIDKVCFAFKKKPNGLDDDDPKRCFRVPGCYVYFYDR